MNQRKAQKARTRDTLKAAAAALLSEGDTELHVADVTARAGVAHGTFYVHFPQHGDLVDELLADFDRGLIEAVVAALPTHAPDVDHLLRTIAAAYFGYWRPRLAWLELYARRLAAVGDTMRAIQGSNRTAHVWLDQAAASLHALSGTPPAQVRVTLQAVLAAWQRVGLAAVRGEVTDDDAAEALSRLSRGALYAAFPILADIPADLILGALRVASPPPDEA